MLRGDEGSEKTCEAIVKLMLMLKYAEALNVSVEVDDEAAGETVTGGVDEDIDDVCKSTFGEDDEDGEGEGGGGEGGKEREEEKEGERGGKEEEEGEEEEEEAKKEKERKEKEKHQNTQMFDSNFTPFLNLWINR